MSTYKTALHEQSCGNCKEYTIQPGEEYVVDADGVVCGYECGCGDPFYADGAS